MSDLEKALYFEREILEDIEHGRLEGESAVGMVRSAFDAARRFASLTSPETIEAWGTVREGLLNHDMPPALWSALGILDHHFTVLRSVEEGKT